MIDLDGYLPGIARRHEGAFAGWLAGAEGPLRRSLRRFAAAVDTESVVQESLLRIWQVAHRCEPDGKPNSLLRLAVRIARNLAVDEIRRRGGALPAGSPDDPSDDGDPVDPAPPPDPLLRKRIRSCLESLAGPPRRALLLRIASAGGTPDRALAEQARMRLNTFLQNVSRARRQLARCLERKGVRVLP
ncbi:MAG TPA: sigma factor [Candidatus Polarisedimenticolia bacterium]|nr:sigma factor [Candidatus Polarisedimenticolia bacterium]